MNAESLSESDLANLRRRLAEARVTDVTEVNKNQLTYSNAKFKKTKCIYPYLVSLYCSF